MKTHHALTYLTTSLWAMEPSALARIAEIAARDAPEIDLSQLHHDIQLLSGKSGQAVSQISEVRENGVGILHVRGPISRYANWMQAYCGGVSTQSLAKAFTSLVENNQVKTIVLNIDSPGGEAKGIHELSAMIANARAKKKITAYVGGMGASAGYWIASAASEIVIDATAQLGSIGAVVQLKLAKNKDNADTLKIVSHQSPKKHLDLGTKEGQSELQSQINELAGVFIATVAKNRGVSENKVISEFGQGGLLMGQSAVKAGLADRLGSLESLISSNNTNQRVTMTTTKTKLPGADALDTASFAASLKQERPDVIQALQQPPESALSHAANLSAACTSQGVPEILASLLQEGVTKAQADSQINTASELKNTLATAGFSDSLPEFLSSLSNPAAMVGKAFHIAKASADENQGIQNQVNAEISGKTETVKNTINAKDIYENRKSV